MEVVPPLNLPVTRALPQRHRAWIAPRRFSLRASTRGAGRGYNGEAMKLFQRLRSSLSPAQRGGLYYLTFFLSMGSFGPFLNIHYLELGFSGRQIGVLAAFFPLMNFLFAAPLSALADRKGWRVQVLQVSIAGVAVFVYLMRYPTSFGGVALTLAFLALFASPIMSIADGLIANMAALYGLNYGGMRLWGSIGFAVSASLFGFLWQRFDLNPMFLIGAALFLPVFIIGSALNPGVVGDPSERKPISGILRDAGLVVLIVTSFLLGISDSLARNFEGIYIRYLGGGNQLVGLLIGFSAASEIVTMQFGQKIAGRIKPANTLILALALLAGAHGGYALASSPYVLLPMAALKGLGFGLFFTNIVRMVNERAPKEWVTTAQSLRSVAMFGLAPLLAGPFGGFVFDAVSPPAVFLVSCTALGLAAVLVGVARTRGTLK